MKYFWVNNAKDLIKEVRKEIGEEKLNKLTKRKAYLHLFYALRQFIFLFGSSYILFKTKNIFLITFFSSFSGLAIFNFLTLLHEALHNLIFEKSKPLFNKFLTFLYSFPTTISPTQFTKWHLDHHLQLGSKEEDPKRHWLSPKINSPFIKILYFTPILFYIYFNAQRNENKRYNQKVIEKIRAERSVFIFIHLIIIFLLFYFGNFYLWFKIYFLPLFIFFPIFFGLNRMGQHYARSSDQPLGWTTLVLGNFIWDFLFLKSNYHLEHHLLVNVPFYNLKKVQNLLLDFYKRKGLKAYSFFEIFFRYIFLNQKPYEVWK